MKEPDDEFEDYYRKGVPLYSPEMFVLLVLVIPTLTLLALTLPATVVNSIIRPAV